MFKIITAMLLGKIAWVDWKTRRIQDTSTLGVLALGIAGIYVFPEICFLQRCAGFFAISIFLLLIVGIVPGSFGGGDIKLMAAAGFLFGIDNICRAFVTGVLTAGVFVSYQLMTGKVNRKSEIALGPFLCMGLFLVLLEI